MPSWKKLLTSGSNISLMVNDVGYITSSLGGEIYFQNILNKPTLVSGSSQINHDSTVGFVSNEHIDHSGVNIIAGGGLTGGGDITTSRTLSVNSASLAIDYDNLYNTPTGIISSSAQINGSQITGVVSASYAVTASYALNGGGGGGGLSNIVEDTTPQLGGNLDAQNYNITGVGSITGSEFTGSFIGNGSGITGIITSSYSMTSGQANSVSFTNITGKPTLVSGSEQISFTGLTDKPTLFSSSQQVDFNQIQNTPTGLVSGSNQIDHDSTTGFVSNEHINHSSVSITAGAGLLGGGDITTSRTLSVNSASLSIDYDNLYNVPTGIISGSDQVSFTGISDKPTLLSSSTQVNYNEVNNVPSGIISSSEQLNGFGFTGSFTGSFYGDGSGLIGVTANSVSFDSITGRPILFSSSQQVDFSQIQNTNGIVSSSNQISYTGITNVPSGILSSSAQVDGSQVIGVVSSSYSTTSSYAEVADSVAYDNITGKPTLVSGSSQINHDNTTGFVSNEHIDHSGVSINAGSGLLGGGDITTSRTLSVNSASLAIDYINLYNTPIGLVSSSNQIDYTGLVNIPTGIISSSNQINGSEITGVLSSSYSVTSSYALNAETVSFTNITGKPTLVSGSGQINHDNTTGFVSNEHIDHSNVSITAGAGLLGGGDITTSRTLSINSASLAIDYTNLYNIPTGILSSSEQLNGSNFTGSFTGSFYGDGSGLTGLTADSIEYVNVLNKPTLFSSSQQVDFNQIQNTTGIVTSSGQISFTGITDKPTLVSGSSQVDHDNTTGFVSNEHINHSSVSIIAGAGLLGGGDITTSRTLSINSASLAIDFDNLYNTPTLISGSSQISYIGIIDIPTGIISSSNQVDYNSIQNTPIGLISSSQQLSKFTGSFTGSFYGDGSGLVGLVADSVDFTNILNKPSLFSSSNQVDYNSIQNTPTGLVSGSVQINHDSTTGFVSNEHIDHSSISINAGAGLFGGGNITTSRTLSVDSGSLVVNFNNLSNKPTLVSGSGQISYTGITDVPSGIISGSSQLSGEFQPLDTELTAIAGLVSAADRGIYFTEAGSAALFTLTSTARSLLDDSSTATMRSTLGLGTADSPQFAGVNIGNASDTTITRVSAGNIAIEGNYIYRAGGTDVPVTDGGTGVSTITGIVVGNGTSAFTSIPNSSSNWNTAFSWGDHASAGYALLVGSKITGSFTGSFAGDGSGLTGLVADSVEFSNILNKPTLFSSSQQVDFDQIQNTDGLFSSSNQVSFTGIVNKPTLVSGSSQIDHDSTTGFVSNEHINHSGVSITAGAGLLGGGSITTSRTLSVNSASLAIDFDNLYNKPTLVSGSSQINYSGITGVPVGIVSGSSQISYTGLSGIPSGIISSSTQINGSQVTGVISSSYAVTASYALEGGGINNLVEDTTPQLGGALDAQNYSVSNVNQISATTALISDSITVTSGLIQSNGGGNFIDLNGDGSISVAIQSHNSMNFYIDADNNNPGGMNYRWYTNGTYGGFPTNIMTLTESGQLSASAFIGDGSGLTGIAGGLSNIVEDTTPQLGGTLDTQGYTIQGNGQISGSSALFSGVISHGSNDYFPATTADKVNFYGSDFTNGMHGIALKNSELAFLIPSTTHTFGFYRRVSGTDTRVAYIDGSGNATFSGDVGIGISPSTLIHVYENTSNTGASAGMTIENDGTGDAVINLLLTGVYRWTVGVDNSDSDRFKIGRGSDWTLGTDLSIDTAGNTTFSGNLFSPNTVRSDVYSTSDFNEATGYSAVTSINANSNTPFGSAWYNLVNVRHRGGVSDGNNYGAQIAIGMTDYAGRIAFRQHGVSGAGAWSSWYEVAVEGNNVSFADGDFSGDVNFTGGDLKIGLGASAAPIHINRTGQLLRLDDTSSTGNPYMTFCQNGTQRSFIQHQDTGDIFVLASQYGSMQFKTGTAGSEVTRLTISSGGLFTAPSIYSNNITISTRDVYVNSAGELGYNSSTRKSKTNIKPIKDVEWLEKLNPVEFNYRVHDKEKDKYLEEYYDELEYGLIAEEVEKVNKELISYDPDDSIATVHYRKLTTPLLAGYQQLKEENRNLKERLEKLESLVESLTKKDV